MTKKQSAISPVATATPHTHESFIDIDVKFFRPVGSVTTSTVEMKLVGGREIEEDESRIAGYTDGVVTLVGSYYIKVKNWGGDPAHPKDGTKDMKLTFRLTNTDADGYPEYLLQGIAFSKRKSTDRRNHLGQRDFPAIHIRTGATDPDKPVRTMTVSNLRGTEHQKKDSYDYLILIQKVSDGAFGIIDPEIENEY